MTTTRWVRKGECNNCGYCCRFSFDPVRLFFPNPTAKLEQFLRIRGFLDEVDQGERGVASFARVYLKCQHHIDDKCAIFNSPERPQMCHDFPEKPSQVIHTPCSYWFEDADGREKPIGGNGSSYGDDGEPDYEAITVLQKMGY